MDRPRFSVACRLGMVAIRAVALAAMRTALASWTAMAGTDTPGLLRTSVLGVRFLRGPSWALWAGFAGFGWVELLFENWDWVGAPFGHELTKRLGDPLRDRLPRPHIPVERLVRPTSRPSDGEPPLLDQLRWQTHAIGNFVQILNSRFRLAFARVGGISARVFAVRTESRRDS